MHSDVIKTLLTDRPRDSSAAPITTIMRLYSLPVLVVVFAKRIKRIATFVRGDVRSDAVEVVYRFIAAVVVVVRVHFSGDGVQRRIRRTRTPIHSGQKRSLFRSTAEDRIANENKIYLLTNVRPDNSECDVWRGGTGFVERLFFETRRAKNVFFPNKPAYRTIWGVIQTSGEYAYDAGTPRCFDRVRCRTVVCRVYEANNWVKQKKFKKPLKTPAHTSVAVVINSAMPPCFTLCVIRPCGGEPIDFRV